MLLDVVGIILGRFPSINRIEIESGIIVVDGLDKGSEGILETGSLCGQWCTERCTGRIHHFGSICNGGTSFSCVSSVSIGHCAG